MNCSRVGWLLSGLLVAMLGCSPVWAADAIDPEWQRLTGELAQLDADGGLVDFGSLERYQAQQALDALAEARSRDRPQRLALAILRVQTAQEAAQAEQLLKELAKLEREHEQILLAASRHEVEQIRREVERLRLLNHAYEEEALRLSETAQADRLASEQAMADADAATAEAVQAHKLADARAHETKLAREEVKLANALAADSMTGGSDLPPFRVVDGKTIYTLSGEAFTSGNAALTTLAKASLQVLAGKLAKSKSIRVVGYTDSQGDAKTNLALSKQRAEAVSRALETAGLNPARIKAMGRGEDAPIMDNRSAEGRARNRRVEIVVD